jgi:hypothetical protein
MPDLKDQLIPKDVLEDLSTESNLNMANRFAEVLKRVATQKYSGSAALIEDLPTEEVETTQGDEGVRPGPKVVPATTINLFQHPDAHPLILDLLLLQKYGPAWLEWEVETLQWRIPQDFRTSSVSDLNLSKIQAVKTLHLVDTFWKNWEVFVWCVMPLNGNFPDFGIMQVPDVAQCMVAVDIANKIREDVTWSEEIKHYLPVVYQHNGIFCTIPPLDFVEIDKPSLVDCEAVKEQWPEVRRTGVAPTKETIVAEQLKRLLDAHNYLEGERDLLRAQLPLLSNV